MCSSVLVSLHDVACIMCLAPSEDQCLCCRWHGDFQTEQPDMLHGEGQMPSHRAAPSSRLCLLSCFNLETLPCQLHKRLWGGLWLQTGPPGSGSRLSDDLKPFLFHDSDCLHISGSTSI